MKNLISLFLLASIVPTTLFAQRGDDNDDENPLPLEAARTISLSVSEGSWMSLDVSADGETIVFDFLGDLWTVPIGGGAATQLTSGMAFDAQPRYSPDGTQVVFTSDRSGGENIWVIAADGSDTTQITKGASNAFQSPEWTPDGEYIIATKGGFRSTGNNKLFMYHVDGGSGVGLITEPENLRTIGAAFGPDGRYVWFARRTGLWQYNARFPQYQLSVYDRETGEMFTRSSRYGSAFRPALSPNGQWLVYGTRHDQQTGLRLRNLATGDENWLAYPVQRDDQEAMATRDVLPGYSFTPDSREVVVSYGGKIWRVPVDGSDPVEVPFSIDVDLELGPRLQFDYPISDEPTFTARQIRDAVPSPDGSRIAFTALDRLWVMDYPDGTPQRLTSMEVGEFQPAWSPDGNWIAYVSWSPEGGHIHRMRSNGRGRPSELTVPGYYRQPSWAPDGERIVAIRSSARDWQDNFGPFTGGPTTGSDFVWIASDGGDVNTIRPTGNCNSPHFGSSPERIYISCRGGRLASIRWDGSDRKEHVRVRGSKLPGAENPQNASLVRMAPQGDQALAQVNNDIYVVTVPYVGGETPTISVANPENAAFPARKLTTVGGQFPHWAASGRTVHWSIGHAFFAFDLDAAQAAEDSVEAAREAEAEAEADDEAEDDEAVAAEDEDEGEEEEDQPAYEPVEIRVAISAQRDIPQGTVVLRGARIITMAGDEVIENGDLVITNNRIAGVGPSGQVTVPARARIIDVSGSTILPGFVDTHSHMWPNWAIHKTQIWMYLANLAYGVTTTRDPQTSTTDVLSYSDLVEAGSMLGPRIYSTGPGVFSGEQLRDQDHANDVLRRYSEYYDTKTIKQYVAGNRQQRQWIITAAREQQLMPTTEGALDLKLDLTQIIDGYPGHEHAFPIFPLYDDIVQLVAQSGTVYTPTLLVSYGGPFAENFFYATENVHDDAKLRHFTPHSEIDAKALRRGQNPGAMGWFHEREHVFRHHAEFVRDLVAAGGRVGVGSHGQLQGLGYHWELWAIQSGGLPEHDALRAATIFGAEAIGLGNDIGSIEVGKLADLIVLAANPLDDIRNTNTITHVMKNGRLYDGDTLDEIWPATRPLEGMYWMGREPQTAAGIR